MHTECKMVLDFEDRKNFEGASTTGLRMQTLLSYWNIKATTVEITKVGSSTITVLSVYDIIY